MPSYGRRAGALNMRPDRSGKSNEVFLEGEGLRARVEIYFWVAE